MFTRSAGSQRSLPSLAHPSLEILEDRCALAADALGGALISPQSPLLAAQVGALQSPGGVPSAAGNTAALNQGNAAAALQAAAAQGGGVQSGGTTAAQANAAGLGQTGALGNVPAAVAGNQGTITNLLVAVGNGPGTGAPSVSGVFPNASTLPGLGPYTFLGFSSQPNPVLEFQGRVVLAGTGVQERAATGTGPLTQPPGLYLVGGAGPQEAVPQVRPVRPMLVPLALPSGEQVADQADPDAPADGAEEAAWYATK